jgi:serine O-acetyltransferase
MAHGSGAAITSLSIRIGNKNDLFPQIRSATGLAKVLGNVEIGRDAKVGAGSVVLHDVPPRATVAAVPARIVGCSSGSVPALEMDQSLPDYEIGNQVRT